MEKQSIKALVEVKDGKMLAVASDDSLDRQGDRIKQLDWDLRNFKKNPVLLMSHLYHLPPVGIARHIKITDGKLTFEPEFHEITQQAKEIKKMYFDGIMKAFSVGFIPGKDKNELLEISAVSVPANANALVFEKSISGKQEKEIKEWVGKENKETEEIEEKDKDDLIDPDPEEEERELRAYIKDTNLYLNKIDKSRQVQVKSMRIITLALEKFNKQLGYIQRKIK